MTDPSHTQPRRGFPKGLSLVLGIAAACGALAAYREGSWAVELSAPVPPSPTPVAFSSTAAVLDAGVVSPAPDGSAPIAQNARAPDREKKESPVDPGAYRSPEVVTDGALRVYPLTRNVWVFPRPHARRSWIGFLWFGSSVKVRDPKPISGPSCEGKWYAVEPRGYVCVDDEKATLDPEHESLAGITRLAPNLESPWPHRYGQSIDLRRYKKLPSEKRQRAREWYYRLHERRIERALAGESVPELEGIDLSPAPNDLFEMPIIPRGLRMDRDRLIRRSTVAWTHEVNHQDRAFLLTADLVWVPKDRVIQYPTVTFQGVHLGAEKQLPLAFFRGEDRPAYRLGESGFELAEHTFTRLSHVELTGERVESDDEVFLQTRRSGLYVRESDAVVPRLAQKTPWGTPLGELPDEKAPTRGRQTWMEASILGGWLIAYEGQRPVFTTLISAGRGGPPQRGREPIETASTPTGRFKITGKFATATMVSSNQLVHSSVPWAHNFSGPHALHGAYWHDNWGELMSGGCINVSPLDGYYLFKHFTEPAIPEGWHGVRWLPDLEPATTLLVRRR